MGWIKTVIESKAQKQGVIFQSGLATTRMGWGEGKEKTGLQFSKIIIKLQI